MRLQHYLCWLGALRTPLIPLAWLGLPFNRHVSARHRLMLTVWFLPLFVFYCTYRPYDAWWYTRFLLPAAGALILAALLITRDLLRWLH